MFQLGESQPADCMLQGKVDGREWFLCRYVYRDPNNRSRTYHFKLLLIIPDAPAGLRTPTRAGRAGAAPAQILVGKPIQVAETSAGDQFSRLYSLTAANDEAARRLFSDAVLEYFNSHPGWTVFSAAGHLQFAYHRPRTALESLVDDLIPELDEILELHNGVRLL